MKTSSGIIVIALGLAVQVQAQSFLTNGLVAYYPLNGNANDTSGNGYDGISTAVSYGYDRFNQASNAAVFYPTASIQILGLTSANFLPVTMSVWVNAVSVTGGDTGIICKYAIASVNGYALFAWGNHVHSFYYGSQGEVIGSNGVLPGLNILDGTWHQIVVTYDLTGGSTYVDGVVVESVGWSGTPSAATSPMPIIIGDYASADGKNHQSFAGSLDDVRIYDRALSSAEVAELYVYESVPPCLPHRATAKATVMDGSVVAATVTDLGCGYTKTPLVLVLGGGGSGATATAVVSEGAVVGITVTDGGSGYTNAPTIYIYSPQGLQVGVMKAVKPSFSDLLIGVNYQLQISGDLNTWTNQGTPFEATAPAMIYPQYWDVDNWSQLFFRLQVAP